MQNLIDNYGWWLLALVLIGAEMILPGYFMLWIGIAAGIMGAIVLLVPTLSAIAQALVFALLAILTCTIYWRFIRPLAEHRNDQPLLNRRGDQARRAALRHRRVDRQRSRQGQGRRWIVARRRAGSSRRQRGRGRRRQRHDAESPRDRLTGRPRVGPAHLPLQTAARTAPGETSQRLPRDNARPATPTPDRS